MSTPNIVLSIIILASTSAVALAGEGVDPSARSRADELLAIKVAAGVVQQWEDEGLYDGYWENGGKEAHNRAMRKDLDTVTLYRQADVINFRSDRVVAANTLRMKYRKAYTAMTGESVGNAMSILADVLDTHFSEIARVWTAAIDAGFMVTNASTGIEVRLAPNSRDQWLAWDRPPMIGMSEAIVMQKEEFDADYIGLPAAMEDAVAMLRAKVKALDLDTHPSMKDGYAALMEMVDLVKTPDGSFNDYLRRMQDAKRDLTRALARGDLEQ